MNCLWNNFAVVVCCLHAVFACFKTKIFSKFIYHLCRKTDNMRTGIDIVNPCFVTNWSSCYKLRVYYKFKLCRNPKFEKNKKLYVSVTDILRNIFATTKQKKKIRKSQKNVMKRWTLVCFNCFDYKIVRQRGMITNILFNSGVCACVIYSHSPESPGGVFENSCPKIFPKS